jgi:predicted SnoaL-like aldol condensation-catalyzing enzyme
MSPVTAKSGDQKRDQRYTAGDVMAKATRFLMSAGMLCLAACSTPRFLIEAESARTNTHIVLAFEDTVYNKHHVREAFRRYVAAEYREHDLDLSDGVEGSARDLENQMTGTLANSRIVVKRTIAQGDLVAVQALWDRPPADTQGIVRVDIYRLVNAKIVEHWLVQQSQVHSDSRGPL